MGTLFLVATPIGNLGDISSRALDTLRMADVIACEDTRQTLKLLTHFGLQKPLTSYHDFNEREKAVELAGRIETGESIAVVSDAGTPAISDPGYRLSEFAASAAFPLSRSLAPMPQSRRSPLRACRRISLCSSVSCRRGRSARREHLESLRTFRGSLIFYEGPHRIQDALEDMQLF
jgi:16S rRNA (cytidine1402-2'-O)-methyltransferase